MGKVYTPTPITNIETAESALNQNYADIEAALEQVLDRLGASPNQLENTLDLNSQDVINGKTISADKVEATTVVADNLAGASLGPVTLITLRKADRHELGVLATFPAILGLDGSESVVGDSTIVSGAGLLVPANVGGLALSISGRVYGNKNFSTAAEVSFSGGFSAAIPTFQAPAGGTGTNDHIITVSPILGAPSFFDSPGARDTLIPTSVTGHATNHLMVESHAASLYCPVQEGDILYPFVHFEALAGVVSPTSVDDYELEMTVTIQQVTTTEIPAAAIVEPIFPFAGIADPNI